MFDLIYARHGSRCEILSAIPRPEKGILTAREDKIRWMCRLFSEQVVVNIVLQKEKPLRKLASIQRIWKIEPIEGADRIELAHVLGWQCVVNKGQFREMDLQNR